MEAGQVTAPFISMKITITTNNKRVHVNDIKDAVRLALARMEVEKRNAITVAFQGLNVEIDKEVSNDDK